MKPLIDAQLHQTVHHVVPTLTRLLNLWLISCVALILFFRRRAPAVALGLVGSVVGVICSVILWRNSPIFFSYHPGAPTGVPEGAAVLASCGLVIGGVAGILVMRPKASARFLMYAAACVLVAGSFAAAYLASTLARACPEFANPSRWSCFYRIEVVGPWASNAVSLFLIDTVIVALLLVVSSNRQRMLAADPEVYPLDAHEVGR